MPRDLNGAFSLNVYWCRTAYRESWNYSAHKHSFFELHMPLEGWAEYTVDGKTHSVSSDSYLLFSPEVIHRLENASEDFSEFVLSGYEAI